jgi:O-antigen/teichoic acid export membrane protein
MSYTKKIAYNTIVQYIGKIAGTAISLVLIAALTRYLGVSGYGQYTTVFAYVAFWSVLADFGFFWVLVREISKPETDLEEITNNILTLRTIMGFIVFLAGYIIAQFLHYDAIIKLGIGTIGFAWFWQTLNSTLVGVFQSKLRMDKAVITEVVGKAVILAIALLMIRANLGLTYIFIAYMAGNLVNFLLSALLANQYLHLKMRFNFKMWKDISIMAFPIGISLILNLIYFRIDTVILSLLKGNFDVGIYGAPYKILEILIMLPTLFMGAVFPVLTKYYAEKSEKLNGAIQKAFDFLIILAFPVVFGVFVLAKPIIGFVAGADFVSASSLNLFGMPMTAVNALQFLILSVGFSFISTMYYYLVVILDKQKDIIKPYIVVVLFNVIANFIVIPQYTYIGAAIVNTISELMILIFTFFIVDKVIKTSLNLGVLTKAFIGALVMALVVYFVGNINLFYSIGLGALIYLVFIFATKAIQKDMVLELLKKE